MDIKLDEGFQFGLGAFETIAVEEGRPILLDRHLRRLERAAAFFGFGPASVRGVTEEAVHKFIADQSEEETRHGAVKVVLSGENVLFQMRGNPYTEEKYLRGFVAIKFRIKCLQVIVTVQTLISHKPSGSKFRQNPYSQRVQRYFPSY